MSTYIILSEKKWHEELTINLKNTFYDDKWILIKSKEDFNYENLKKLKPIKIFIPHWSYIIPSNIYENFECVVFHMTDLPYGRGGSPLQNLIIRDIKKTKISALRVEKGLDTGKIYLKKSLKLDGTAHKILTKASSIIEKMIIEIVKKNSIPKKQTGDVVEFKRRTPEESDIYNLTEIKKIYDYIRMLDCEGYPKAFIETNKFKFEFTNANYNIENEIIDAHVRIIKK